MAEELFIMEEGFEGCEYYKDDGNDVYYKEEYEKYEEYEEYENYGDEDLLWILK